MAFAFLVDVAQRFLDSVRRCGCCAVVADVAVAGQLGGCWPGERQPFRQPFDSCCFLMRLVTLPCAFQLETLSFALFFFYKIFVGRSTGRRRARQTPTRWTPPLSRFSRLECTTSTPVRPLCSCFFLCDGRAAGPHPAGGLRLLLLVLVFYVSLLTSCPSQPLFS